MFVFDMNTLTSVSSFDSVDIHRQLKEMTYTDTCNDQAKLEVSCFSAQSCKQSGRPGVYIRGDTGTMYVFVDGAAVIGSMSVSPARDVKINVNVSDTDVFISDFCVAHRYRRGGRGKAMLTTVMREFPASTLYLTVHVLKDTPRTLTDRVVLARSLLLVPFYKSFGFSSVHFYKDYLVMRRIRIAEDI